MFKYTKIADWINCPDGDYEPDYYLNYNSVKIHYPILKFNTLKAAEKQLDHLCNYIPTKTKCGKWYIHKIFIEDKNTLYEGYIISKKKSCEEIDYKLFSCVADAECFIKDRYFKITEKQIK